MVRVASPIKRTVLAVAAMLFVFGKPAFADSCVDGCRGEHNSCRMAAKLLMSSRCDDQLQACISGCFAAGREAREPRGGREFGGAREPHFGGGFRDRR